MGILAFSCYNDKTSIESCDFFYKTKERNPCQNSPYWRRAVDCVNEFNVTDLMELDYIEERVSKKKALELFDSGKLDRLQAGTFEALK